MKEHAMHHDKKLYGTVTVGTKGQVVIPVEAREAFGIEAGDRLYVVGAAQHGWIGLLKEEQMQEVVDHLTEKLESLRELLPRKTRNQ
jgi:AbrB family looped-hinge helix DNA binding protein